MHHLKSFPLASLALFVESRTTASQVQAGSNQGFVVKYLWFDTFQGYMDFPSVSLTTTGLTLVVLILQETEKHLSDMVVSKALKAKVDRPAAVVSFQSKQDSHDVLNSWAVSIEKLLELVEKSCHQIHKETMVHKVALKVQ
jgi:phage terminase large subunit-like protein